MVLASAGEYLIARRDAVRTFDFGLFLPIANNGMIASTAYQYMPTFALNKAIALSAERLDYSFIFSMTKWRGYGGTTQHWDHAKESFSLMSGLAAVTERIRLVTSVALPTLHPAVAARMATTLDDISNGRLVVNIVAGWNKLEYSQMGLWPGDAYFGYRYDYASEYVTVLRRLWDEGRVTFKGRYFELDDCVCLPKPSRHIPLIGAGQSETGMRSAAQWADYNFIFGDVSTAGELTARTARYAAEAGRKVATYVLIAVVAEETDEKAQEVAQRLADTVDLEAVEKWRALGVADTKGSASERHKADVFMGVTSVIGSYERVADYFDRLSHLGIQGAAMFFPDWLADVEKFGKHVMPLMRARLGMDPRRDEMRT
jgi:pyrimidine oxygenase